MEAVVARTTDAQALQDQAHTFATAANVALVIGGVAVVGGITWGVLSRKQDRDAPAKAPRIGIGVGSINATWVFE